MNGVALLVALLCGLLGMAIAAAGMARERLRETRLRLAVYREHCAALTAQAGAQYDKADTARDRERNAVDMLVAVLEENRARGYCPGCMGGFDGETMPSAQMSCAEGCAVWEVCRFITGRVPSFYMKPPAPAARVQCADCQHKPTCTSPETGSNAGCDAWEPAEEKGGGHAN